MEWDRHAHVAPESVVSVVAQQAIPREFYCRGVRFNSTTGLWARCGNMSKFYVFVSDADEARQAVCGICRNKAAKGRLTVLK